MLKRYTRRFIPRYWSNDELRALSVHFPRGARIVNVSGWQDSNKEDGVYRDCFRAPAVYHVSNYGGDQARGTNVQTDLVIDLGRPLPVEYDGRYDIAFSHTVLEHVEDPAFAFAQIAKLTTDLIVTVVPFKQKLHFENGMYGDEFRFTPCSMRPMHEKNGFSVLYESYTPRPALEVYLLYVGTRDSGRRPDFPKRLTDLGSLNQRVGSFSARDLAANIIARFLIKYVV